MKFLLLILLLFFFVIPSFSQQDEINFGVLRQDDDLTALSDSLSGSAYERFKRISFGQNSELSFGGSYRTQLEAFVNENFDNSIDQNDYWSLNRFMLHANYEIADRLQIFGELNSSLIFGKDNLAPVDKDELNVNQLFARYEISSAHSIMIGRKNMRLGSGRLVDIREGPNVRLSFDMMEYDYKSELFQLKLFAAIPVQLEPGIFDNEILRTDEYVLGLHLTKQFKNTQALDGYVLWKTEANKTWEVGTANDRRASIGIRHYGKWKGFRFNNESVIQLGTFGQTEIQAWTLSFNVEREFIRSSGKTKIGLKTELISGDNENRAGILSTFDGLYPRGAYFGRVARFGPSNLVDVHPYINFQRGRFFAELDYVYFLRFSTSDGIYNPALILEYPSLNGERGIAHQVGTITGFAINKFFSLELETNLIFPDEFLIDSGLNDTLFHTVLTAEVKF